MRVAVSRLPARVAVPGVARTRKVFCASTTWSESTARLGTVRLSVSGSVMSYDVSCGSVIRASWSVTRVTDGHAMRVHPASSAGKTTAFQPPASDCADTKPASSARFVPMPAGVPSSATHASSTMLTSRLMPAYDWSMASRLLSSRLPPDTTA